MRISSHRGDLILGIVTNSYDIPGELLPEDRVEALGILKAKGPCPFVDGRIGAKCINEFCHQQKPKAVSSDDCLLLSEDDNVGRTRAIELLYHLGLSPRDAFASFCMSTS